MRRSDIVVAPHIGPVLREHRPTEWIDFNLPLDLKTCALKAQIESTDPREETANRESWGVSHV
jgi:hypothetical protein